MSYKDLCYEVCKLSKDVGKYLKEEIYSIKNSDVQSKGLHDYVTYADKKSEQLIVSGLNELAPNFNFLAEEGSEKYNTKKCDYWIIDPLDGTTNFIHGIPLYSVSIALMVNNALKLGVIYEPNLDECFYAWKDGGAYLNNKKISVSKTELLTNSVLATGFPYYDYSKLNQYIEFLKFTMQSTRGLRRLGSAAVDMAYVAAGRFDGFYEYGLKPWDVAAGALIIEEAGGKVSDFSKKNNYIFGQEIITSNSFIFDELHSEFKKYFT